MNKEKTLTPEEIVENMYSIGPDNFEGLSELFVTKSDAIDALDKYGQQEYNRGKTEAQQWISVEDELPPHNRYILANLRGHPWDTQCVVYYDIDKKEWNTLRGIEILKNVTHWMPLPSAPTQGKETTHED